MTKRYWVEESSKTPVVAKIDETEMPSNSNKKTLPYHIWTDQKNCRHSKINKCDKLGNIVNV